MRLALALLALSGAFLPALAHDRGPGSWINQQALKDPLSNESCCNLHDCAPTKVREVSGGYIVETGEFVIRERVLWRSQDGQWWRCRYILATWHAQSGKTRCLIGPPPGS